MASLTSHAGSEHVHGMTTVHYDEQWSHGRPVQQRKGDSVGLPVSCDLPTAQKHKCRHPPWSHKAELDQAKHSLAQVGRLFWASQHACICHKPYAMAFRWVVRWVIV